MRMETGSPWGKKVKMTNIFWLDWATMAISLTDTILLIWLGLTVILNAERKTWGALVAGGGLLLGGMFFFSHSAILGYGENIYGQGLNFWWQLGWVPVVALPFAWYVVILWYVGFWDDSSTTLHKRHKPLFRISIVISAFLVGLLIFANPIPSFAQFADFGLSAATFIGDYPFLVIFYPVYIIFCISLSLDALRKPGPTGRVMGDLARQRARPWLAATSIMLLVVSLLIAWVMFWLSKNAVQLNQFSDQSITLSWFDLIIETIIGIAVILLGQSIVAYEIFTGKALPRRGLLRHWRRAIILAVGYGFLVSFSFLLGLRSIYTLLLTAVMMTLFYALLSWRSYTERERYIDNLRPFVRSQGLFDKLITQPSTPIDLDIQTPFDALCNEVLNAKTAYLVPIGPLSALVGNPLAYPESNKFEPSGISKLISSIKQKNTLPVSINPKEYSGSSWAVSLWSERGMIGILLLGEKRDGGLYTQEEMEIAQTSAERLIDTKASSEISQKLMELQRHRMAESQIIDQRTRRVLHDDVLQQIHAVMLKLIKEKSKPNGGTSEAIEILADVHSQISDLLRDMPTTTLPEISQLGFIGALKKAVDEELGLAFETVKWQIDFEAERHTQTISPLTAEVLYYATREAIRNAAKHGRVDEMIRPLHLAIKILWRDGLLIQVEDDGKGVITERNIQTPQERNSGHGLALHSTMMAVVGGELALESEPGEYTRVSLTLPQIS